MTLEGSKEERIQATKMFINAVGIEATAKFIVNLNESIEGLLENNNSLIEGFKFCDALEDSKNIQFNEQICPYCGKEIEEIKLVIDGSHEIVNDREIEIEAELLDCRFEYDVNSSATSGYHGTYFCKHEPFKNLQESDCYGIGKTKQEALEDYKRKFIWEKGQTISGKETENQEGSENV